MSRQLLLSWGVTPLGVTQYHTIDELLSQAEEAALTQPFMQPGDTIVVVAGMPLGTPTNFITFRILGQR